MPHRPSVHRWRTSLVRPAGGGDRRRAGDVVRLIVGTVAAAVVFEIINRVPWSDSGLASWVTELAADLPWIGGLSRMLLVAVVPALVAVISLVTQSWRLLLSAATAAVSSAVLVAAASPVTTPSADRQAQLDALQVGGSFPLLEVAVPVAILVVASAFLARPAYRLLLVTTWTGLVAFVLGGEGLVLDVIASAFAGWAAAGVAGLVFGAPVGDATPDEVAANLDELGLTAAEVTEAGHPVWGTARYRATLPDGEAVVVDAHGREAQEARALQRMWHAIVDKGGGATLAVDRRSQAEHEALALTLAERGGVPVPRLVAVGAVGPAEDGYVVASDPAARPLRDLDEAEVTDDVLAAAWAAVARCRAAGLAHGRLDGHAVEVLDDGSVQLVDWFAGRSAPSDEELAADVATLLMVTAAKTDASRAVRAVRDAVGTEAVTAALALCQVGVLDRRARHDVDKHVAAAVRAEAASQLEVDEPELVELRRVSPSSLLMLAGSLLGFWLLYNQLASLDGIGSTLADADWAWVAVVLVLAQFSVLFTAIGLRGAVVQPLPLARLVALEYADLFTGLVGGTVAITATNIRFFQRQGLAGATAVTSGVVSSLAGGAIQALIILVSLPYLIRNEDLIPGDTGGGGAGRALVLVILAVALISGVVALIPRFRRAVVAKAKPQLGTAWTDVRELAKRPRNIAAMVGGAFFSQLALAMALGASLAAFGGHLGLPELLLVNTIAALIGGLAPVPGGMGAVEAGLIAGLTAFGVDATLAGAATFTYRLFTAYLPPAWGWPTLAWMRRREYL